MDRKGGDVHPNGNPHYNTDLVYGQMIARGIASKLGQIRPDTPRSAFHHQALRDYQADSFAKQPFESLSGGQRQRVLLARALASSLDCLLLDEPTAGVDRPTQFALAEILGELHTQSGRTIVLVTHEFAPFKNVAKRFVWVADGSLRELTAGDFTNLQANPAL